MLTEEQLEILSETLEPLFQYLEKEVIADVARRIQKTMTYTRTAELQAMSMRKLGYSPAKIRSEAMKLLRADPEYRKAVAKNTLEYKREVRNIINDITKQAYIANEQIIKDAGDMSWTSDLGVWKQAGKELTDNSYLPQLVDAFTRQTAGELKNMTRTTGFKTMSGFEAVENLYRRELDKAAIKVCSGTFTQDRVVKDIVRDLSKSGLRSIDYSTGYSMQLDTAARLAVRTGCNQLQAKITDANIEQTGENLVYVSKHWGARNKGEGVENHEQWQGKVYFVQDGTNYTEEAKRIGQDRIMSLWYSTGYSVDGTKANNPLGLRGYNCRHNHHPWFEGVSTWPKADPEPAPVTIDGKTYDYYAMTQKMRSMERGVRALKREKEALRELGIDTTEIDAKISNQTRKYKEFCKACNIKEKPNRMAYQSGTSDLKKTDAWENHKKSMRAQSNDIGHEVYFDDKKSYEINLDGKSEAVNKGLSKSALEVAKKGSETRHEHMGLVDLDTGEIAFRHTDQSPNSVGGRPLYNYLQENKDRKFAFIHNHNTATELSLGDIELMIANPQLPIVASVRNDGIIYLIETNGKHTDEFLPLKYDKERMALKLKKYGKAVPVDRIAEYNLEVELLTRDLAIKEFSKKGIELYG